MQTDNKIHLSLLGGSPLIDILALQGEAGTYTVDRSVLNIHPVSMFQDSPLLTDGDSYLSQVRSKSEDIIRSVKLDMEKGIFDYIAEVSSDYILVDTYALGLEMVQTDKGYATIIEPGFLTRAAAAGVVGAISHITYSKLDKNLLTESLDALADKLTELFAADRIILVEYKAASFVYNTATGRCNAFGKQQVSALNEAMQFGFNHLKTRLPEAHIIPAPVYILGNVAHKNGSSPVNYVADYYKYAFNALNSIIFASDRASGEAAVTKACQKLSDTMLRMELNSAETTIRFLRDIEKKANSAKALTEKLKVGEEDMFAMITEPECLEAVHAWFAERNIRTCALHGLNAVSKLYIALFKKWNIFPAYIVDDYTAEERYNGILIVKRNQDEYPEVNCMLICDSWVDKVQTHLNSIGYKGLVTDYKTLMTPKKEEETKA